MRSALFLSVLSCVTAFAAAQTQIPIPAFNRTFSGQLTRGFWFQAPTTFVITGVRVPDESGQGVQCVEISRMTSAPPAFSSTIQPTQLFYANNQPSASILPCNVLVNQGDFIGVLGACGSSTMYNSYGPTGAFQSNVLGFPVTLTRFLMQSNLSTSGGNQPCASEAAFEVARVEVYAVPAAGFAAAAPFGTGCGGITLAPTARPVIGMTAGVETGSIPTGSLAGVTAFGLAQVAPPLDLSIIGMTGCTLLRGLRCTGGLPGHGRDRASQRADPAGPDAGRGAPVSRVADRVAGHQSVRHRGDQRPGLDARQHVIRGDPGSDASPGDAANP